MKSENKIESINLILKLKLNTFPERLFLEYNPNSIEEFIKEFTAEFYAVRDKSFSMSPKSRLAVPYNEVIDYCKCLNKFSINVSSYCYRNNQICVGEIRIYKNMGIEYIVSNNPSYSLRDCYTNPDFNGQTNIYDKKINKIPGLNEIIDYISKYNLFEIIVEFSVFNCPVGINKENIIIWELRTNY
jgi:hypothetical protein